MTTQITVRLPDESVAYIDGLVREGHVSSRAEAVHIALVRDRRRRTALKDVEILRATGDQDPELEGIARHQAAHPVNLDD